MFIKTIKKIKKTNIKVIVLVFFIGFLLYFLALFLYRDYKYSLIKKLVPTVQLSYFKKYLGEPVFLNFSEKGNQKEYIFVDNSFYAQVITDKNDKVLAFFITSKDKNFNPKIKTQVFEITLGQSTLFDMAKNTSPSKCFGFLGNTAKRYYVEEYYFGRMGKYLNYIFGYNDAGFAQKDKNNLSFLIGKKNLENNKEESSASCQEVNDHQRKSIIINTFGVKTNDEINFEYGVDKNLVEIDFIK